MREDDRVNLGLIIIRSCNACELRIVEWKCIELEQSAIMQTTLRGIFFAKKNWVKVGKYLANKEEE